MDFSKDKLSKINYGGSERKIGIFHNGERYMLKFQKKSPYGLKNNHISEYLGSKIFSMLGFSSQELKLGVYRGEKVVACKDFISQGMLFVPFNDIGESTLEIDKELYKYTYEHIMQLLIKNKKLTNIKETISTFWDIYIVDALIGNFDRHGSNWGFIKFDNKYHLSPVFDNGSCLYPNMIDENEMLLVMNSETETKKRIYEFPKSQIKLNEDKSSYYDVIYSCKYEECNQALLRVFPRINLNNIYMMIDDIDIISDTHKEFYKYMILKRYELILKATYIKLKGVIV